MKKLTYTTAILIAMAATSVFAHHPSADMNPNYETVDAQLADTPHGDMLPDDMGANTAAGESDTANAAQASTGDINTERAGEAEPGQPQSGDGPGMDAAAAVGTIDLMENIE